VETVGIDNITIGFGYAPYTNCSIIQETCPTGYITNNSTCFRFEELCQGSLNSNGCEISNFPISYPCSGSHQCFLEEIICNGTVYDVTKFNGSFSDCFVASIRCLNVSYSIQNSTNFTNCTTFCNESIPLENCSVDHLQCKKLIGNWITNASCTQMNIQCKGMPDCGLIISEFSCENPITCYDQVNETYCVCPTDRNGLHCEQQNPIVCQAQLASPLINCDSESYKIPGDEKQDLLDGDKACLVFALEEAVNLEYFLNCQFSNPPSITSDIINANFSYYVQNDRFTLSEVTLWIVQMKMFNFNVLSDKDGVISTTLDTYQMQGIKPIWLNTTNLFLIPSKFWFGNRIYAEIMFDEKYSPPVSSRLLDRRFFDSPDYKSKGTNTSYTNYTITILIVVLVIIACGVLIVIWKRYGSKLYIMMTKKPQQQ